MIKTLFAAMLLVFLANGALAGTSGLDGYTPVLINNGPNTLHVAGHDVMVFRAWRENYNAHGFDLVTLYIKGDGASADGVWNLLPVFGDAGDALKERYDVTVSGGADCVLNDFRLLRSPDGKSAELILAHREMGESFAAPAAVHFDYYTLTKNEDGTVGYPAFYFTFQKRIAAKASYCDVNEAFDKELHLGTSSGKGGFEAD